VGLDPAAHARNARAAKAAALDDLENSRLSLREVLRSPPEALRHVDLYEVLMRTPHLNRVGTERVCKDASIWPHLRLGEMTKRERSDVIRALPNRVE
jgi:hypothetical protein